MNKAESKFSCYVSCVLLILDDYNNKPVSQSLINIRTNQKNKPIVKDGGYYVFTNIADNTLNVSIESMIYQKRTISIDISKNNKAPIMIVRLTPSRRYAVPQSVTSISAKLKPLQCINIVLIEKNNSLKLLNDYNSKDDSKELSIFNPDKKDVEGRLFCILNKNENLKDYFYITQKCKKQDTYMIDKVLTNDYKKTQSNIYRMFEVWSDSDGNIYLPIPDVRENVECMIIIDNQILTRKIQEGIENIIDI